MPIGNCVYLDFLLSRVMQFKINYIFLSLYYNHELFLDYLKVTDYTDYIEPIIEPEPLGTGGAINYVIENTTIKILLRKHNNIYIGKYKEMEFSSTGK